MVSFSLNGYEFMAISAGPYFTTNPSISFFVNFDPSVDADASKKLEKLWQILSEGGTELMPLQEYAFSKKYGWIQDKFGVSWQLMLTDPEGEPRPYIIPSMLFVGDQCGNAQSAIDFYLSIFHNSKKGTMAIYPPEMKSEKEGTLMFGDFMLENQWFAAMDSAQNHKFQFNEGISFVVQCEKQEEIDYYFEKLSAVPEAEQCGWLKDRFGVSWQVTPTELQKLLDTTDQEKINRVTQAFLQMKKFDIATLRKAAE